MSASGVLLCGDVMPFKPAKPCNHPGCPSLTHATYCPTHARARKDSRPSAAQRGYGRTWQVVRRAVLEEQPLCICGRPATEVHHRRELRDGGTHDRANLVALCHSCHVTQTHAAKRARQTRIAGGKT